MSTSKRKNGSENISSAHHYNEVYVCGRVRGTGVETTLPSGDITVEIEGALRCRFWQGTNGVASRWQIEAFALEKS